MSYVSVNVIAWPIFLRFVNSTVFARNISKLTQPIRVAVDIFNWNLYNRSSPIFLNTCYFLFVLSLSSRWIRWIGGLLIEQLKFSLREMEFYYYEVNVNYANSNYTGSRKCSNTCKYILRIYYPSWIFVVLIYSQRVFSTGRIFATQTFCIEARGTSYKRHEK